MQQSKKITRREFVETAAKIGLLVSASGCSSIPLTKSEPARAAPEGSKAKTIVDDPDRFQYIVVGAGAGGGPLAVRLAERGFDVLLLDAGSDELPQSAVVPAFHAQSTEDPAISWDYIVKHRDEVPPLDIPGVESSKDQSSIWYPRASGIGGCTLHNAMVAMYPNPQDWEKIYDAAKASGDRYAASWQPAKMRELYDSKVERKGYSWGDNSGWHHLEMSSLWQGVTDPNLRKTLLQAAQAGDDGSVFDVVRDVNRQRNSDKEGFFMIPKSTRNGSRFGVHNYVMENQGRTRLGGKLTVMPHSLVKKIVFKRNNDQSLTATAVEVARGKHLYRAHRQSGHHDYETKIYKANNEIILCAGAFNTPQLLMLSGIGPTEHFASAAWKRVKDGKQWMVLEGVGQNLQDRYEVSVVSEYKRDFNFISNCEFKADTRLDPCYDAWTYDPVREKSIYASNGISGGVKRRSRHNKRTGGPQDLIMFGLPGDFRGYYPGYSNNLFGPDGRARNLFSWAILKGYSNNRSGQVKLKTADFRDTPEIDFNYFAEGKDQDLEAIYEAIQEVRGTNSQLGEMIEKELYPGNKVSSEADLKVWIEREAWGHHASCSARMGHQSDSKAVTDYNFKVHGTQNLRIVDASVFPDIPGLFISVPIYMIAERAAEVIEMEYQSTRKNTPAS
jgi:choline dehydrogenase